MLLLFHNLALEEGGEGKGSFLIKMWAVVHPGSCGSLQFQLPPVPPGLLKEAGLLSPELCFLLLRGCLALAQQLGMDTLETQFS